MTLAEISAFSGFLSIAIVALDKLSKYYPSFSIRHIEGAPGHVHLNITNIDPYRSIYVKRISIYDKKLKVIEPIKSDEYKEILPNQSFSKQLYMEYPVDVKPERRIFVIIYWGVFGRIIPRIPFIFSFKSSQFRKIGGV